MNTINALLVDVIVGFVCMFGHCKRLGAVQADISAVFFLLFTYSCTWSFCLFDVDPEHNPIRPESMGLIFGTFWMLRSVGFDGSNTSRHMSSVCRNICYIK